MNFPKGHTPKPFYLHEDSIDSHPELTSQSILHKNIPFYLNSELKTSPIRERNYKDDLVYPLSASSLINDVNINQHNTHSQLKYQRNEKSFETKRTDAGFWNESYMDPLSNVQAVDTGEILKSFKTAIEVQPELTLGFTTKRPNFNHPKENDEEKFWDKFSKESQTLKKQNSSNPKKEAMNISESEHKYLGEVKVKSYSHVNETAKFISSINPCEESCFEDFDDKKCYFSSQLECLLFLDSTQFQLKFHIPEIKEILLAVFEGYEDFFVLVLWQNENDILVVHTPKLSFYDFIEEKFEEFEIDIKIVSSTDMLSKRLADLEERIESDFFLENKEISLKESNISPPIEPISQRSEKYLDPSMSEKKLNVELLSPTKFNFEVQHEEKIVSSSRNKENNLEHNSSSSGISDISSKEENEEPEFKMENIATQRITNSSKNQTERDYSKDTSSYRMPEKNINFEQPSYRASERNPILANSTNLTKQKNSHLEGLAISSRGQAINPENFDPIAYKEHLRIQREEQAHQKAIEEARLQAIKDEAKKKSDEEERLKFEAAENARIELQRQQEEEEINRLMEQQRLLDEESIRRQEERDNLIFKNQEPNNNSLSFGQTNAMENSPEIKENPNPFTNEENTLEKKMEEALKKSMEEDKVRKIEEDKKAEIEARRREKEDADRERERLKKMKSKFTDALKFLSVGHEFLKYGYKNVRSPNKRFIHFSEDMINFYWNSNLKKKVPKNSTKIYSTTDILDVLDGRISLNFKRFKPKSKQSEILSFSLIIKGRSIDLEAKNYEEKCQFIESVKTVAHVLKDEELYERIILSAT